MVGGIGREAVAKVVLSGRQGQVYPLLLQEEGIEFKGLRGSMLTIEASVELLAR